jgi:hypothetical protein
MMQLATIQLLVGFFQVKLIFTLGLDTNTPPRMRILIIRTMIPLAMRELRLFPGSETARSSNWAFLRFLNDESNKNCYLSGIVVSMALPTFSPESFVVDSTI